MSKDIYNIRCDRIVVGDQIRLAAYPDHEWTVLEDTFSKSGKNWITLENLTSNKKLRIKSTELFRTQIFRKPWQDESFRQSLVDVKMVKEAGNTKLTKQRLVTKLINKLAKIVPPEDLK